MDTDKRRFEIDWLRVIAFLLLILFHTGMFFVPWDFHFKNSETSELFELWMTPLNQFRLPLLFMISGMGAFFVLKHRNISSYFGERHKRLLLPLVFGMFVIIPPQIFFEHQFKGVNYSNYFEFYKKVFEFIPYPEGSFSWHHLWYITYIFIYSIICFPLIKFFKESSSDNFKNKLKRFLSKPGRIYLMGLPLLLVFYGLSPFFPTTHALFNDWFNFTFMLIFFVYGIVIISVNGIWEIIESQRKTSLIIAAVPFTFLWLFIWGPTFEIMREDTWAFFFFYGFLKITFVTAWLLAVLGYSRKFFSKSNKFLRYATEAVYPFYILHQTIMITFGYYIVQLPLGILPKFLLVALVTFVGSWAVYEIFIKRFNFMRILLGQKPIYMSKLKEKLLNIEQADSK